ncbi:Cytochrome P450 6B2 [Ooceraea biroi]|uniref:Cytochrome P450 6B2 n=1 Tax=Ooceraea biroi TaxID=2015173 RepID=A0A026WD66_OOCBI|nr:Cytochrome P450 6B2 [Ooceraea biroi]
MGPFEVLCGIAAVILAVYYYFTSTFDFWKSRGIRGPQPIPIFGTVKNALLMKQSMGDYLMQVYNDYKDEPVVGIFSRREPVLVVKDAELIKEVLIKDFSKFADRGIITYDKVEPLSQHLFNLEPKRWRPLRMKLSPVFTSGKLKEMFSLISDCAENLGQYVEKVAIKNEAVECRELTAKYTTDVIGTCAFGIEMNALSDEDSEFRKVGRAVFATSWLNVIRFRLRRSFPWLFTLLAYILPYTKSTRFFMRTIAESIDYREKNNIVRHDFVDILRELKKHPDKVSDITLTDSLLVSQAFVFFVAGFETSSTTMSNALYELALNPKVQSRLREEIDQEYAKHGSNLTYENIKSMPYLDKVFKETLRNIRQQHSF